MLSLSHTNMHTHTPHAQMEDCDIQVLMWWTIVRGCWYDGCQFSVCFLLWYKVFSLENASKWFFFSRFCFSVLISAHENHRKTLKKALIWCFFKPNALLKHTQTQFETQKQTTSCIGAGLLIDFAIRQNPHMKDLCSCLDIWTMFFCTAGIKVLVEHGCW